MDYLPIKNITVDLACTDAGLFARYQFGGVIKT